MLAARRLTSVRALAQRVRRQHSVKKIDAPWMEKLLFREAPIALSLVERSLPRCGETTPPTTSSSSSPSAQDALMHVFDGHNDATRHVAPWSRVRQLISSVAVLENARIEMFQRKRQHVQHRRTLLQEQRHNEEVKDELRAIQDDLHLLDSSIIARPLLSARLWSLMLEEEVWAPYLQANSTTTSSSSSSSKSVLHELNSLARLSLGALQHYVNGGSINASSPRFAVSLPSRSWRARQGTTAQHTEKKHREEDEDDDLLLSVLGGASPTTTTTTSSSSSPSTSALMVKAPTPVAASMRWIPAHASSRVVPLCVRTISMAADVLPHVELDDALLSSDNVALWLRTLATLQRLATATLLLSRTSVRSLVEEDELHAALRALEEAMMRAASTTRTAMLAHVTENMTLASGTTTASAARMLMDLHGLQQLRGEPGDVPLIDAMLMHVFPSLASNTRQVLQRKAKSSSLLSYATSSHRRQLLRTCGSHAAADNFLRGTIIQRARLQQRQMASALRQHHLDEVHARMLMELANGLSPADLIRFFSLLASSVGRGGGASMEGVAEERLVVATMFVGEAMLLSGCLHDDQRALPLITQTSLLRSMVELWPTLMHRTTGNVRGTDAVERHLLASLTEVLAISINVRLGEELRNTSSSSSLSAHNHGNPRKGRGRINADGQGTSAIGAHEVHSLARALQAWAEMEMSSPVIAKRHGSMVQQLLTTSKMLRECVLHHQPLWASARNLPHAERELLQATLMEMFGALKLKTSAVDDALEHMCSSNPSFT